MMGKKYLNLFQIPRFWKILLAILLMWSVHVKFSFIVMARKLNCLTYSQDGLVL